MGKRYGILLEMLVHYKKSVNPWRILRDGFRERHREYTSIDNIQDPKLWISCLRPNTHSHI
jgi:hypothetical protein